MPFPSSTILLSLLYTVAYSHPTNIWHVSIDEGPAPPPDEGPPLSAHATRDKSKLKYELIAILGAYVFWVFISVVLITVIRRRLQQRKRLLLQGLHKEPFKTPTPVQPATMTTTTAPLSPGLGRLTSWISPGKGHKHQMSQTSVSTVDERVLEADRARNMDDMERLYAAVMQQDEQKAQQPRSPTSGEGPLRSPINAPAELQHLRQDPAVVHPSSQSMATTVIEDETRTLAASRASSRKTKASPLSFLSHTRTDSANSNRSRPSRISFRGQAISKPIGSPSLADSSVYSDEVPLSPRIYSPGPAPPTPRMRSPAAVAREAERGGYPQPQSLNALAMRNESATYSTGSLPFRQVYADSMKSAPATKTTFLEKRQSILHPAPKTGIPSIPYSPYQPYTPVTPITPHLVTKEELKRNKKKYGGPLTPDDVVQSDEDMWGKMI